ncbi:MAG: Asp-tRNA(Asn)/Glu-tRNA(Gln) amidotransferase subunit GatB [Candidatus Woesearchaeota archaeon]
MIKVGLEIHVTLNTKSKLFCSCSSKGDVNENVCPVCLGYPGSRLTLNKQALLKALKIAKALNCEISDQIVFARKSYFYPDLSKNYQVSMLNPLGINGYLDLDGKKIRIKGVHLEEDPASATRKKEYSLLDYSRSGVPLAEIVTEPDIVDQKQARLFMQRLLRLLKYLNVFELDGIIKADVNVSIKKTGFKRVEIKNVTGFKDIQKVIEHEISRQEKEGAVLETRGWDAKIGKTYSMRKKESAIDYGYIYEPDIPKIKNNFEINLVELPELKLKRYTKKGISLENANIIASEPEIAVLFDEVLKEFDPLFSAKFFRNNLLTVLNETSLEKTFFNKKNLIAVMTLYKESKINNLGLEKIMDELTNKNIAVVDFANKHGLIQIKDDSKLLELSKEAVKENPEAVKDYKAGEQKSLNYLVGQVMKKSKGKADPAKVFDMIKNIIK